MAEAIAALTVEIDANTTKLVSGTQVALDSLDQFAVQTITVTDAQKVLADAGDKTSNTFSKLGAGVGQVDRTLGLMGVNVGRLGGALTELGTLAAMAGSKLGLIGLAVGTAVAATQVDWQKTFTAIDQFVADSTAKLLGWGDRAAEAAAAGADTLARASAVAGREITSMDQAVQILTQHVKESVEAQQKAAQATRDWISETSERLIAGARAQQDAIKELASDLLGSQAVDNAERYLAAVERVRAQGLEPVKAMWPEIAAAADKALTVLEQRGETTTARFRELAALAVQFSAAIDDAAPNIATGPGLVGAGTLPTPPGGIQGVGEAPNVPSWAERYAADVQVLDAEVRKYYELQGVVFEDAKKGVEQITEKFHGWHGAILQVSGGIQALVPQGFSLTQAYKDAGFFINDAASQIPMHMRGLRTDGVGRGVTVNVDASGSFYDNPASIQALADRVGNAVIGRFGRGV
jgi:hypothetical protein